MLDYFYIFRIFKTGLFGLFVIGVIYFVGIRITCYINDLTIADTVVDVPMTRADKPKMINNEFFTIIINFEKPDLVLTKTKLSITAGSIIPSKDKQKAPNNDINKSNLGIATANRTAKK